MNAHGKLKLAGLALFCMFLFTACASTPKIDPRVTALEGKLMALESNAELASRGGDALKIAKTAVQKAVSPGKRLTDEEEAYRFYAADRLLQTAEMRARARLAEDRRKELVKEQDRLVLEARTLEADRARQQAQQARQSAAEAMTQRERALAETAEAQKLRDEAQLARAQALESQRSAETAAESARQKAQSETERAELAAMAAAEEARKASQARAEAEAAKAEMESMRGRLSELEAKQTERGLLITLGDVLFEFNKSDLKAGGARNLRPLAEVLKERTEQPVIIEGHTDSVGNHAYNMTLSEKRALAVEKYLVDQGIDVSRITSTGLGPDFPVADNGSSEGRQRNRRVEVILPNLK